MVAPIASELNLPIVVAGQNRITVNGLTQTLVVSPSFSLSDSIVEAACRLKAHDESGLRPDPWPTEELALVEHPYQRVTEESWS